MNSMKSKVKKDPDDTILLSSLDVILERWIKRQNKYSILDKTESITIKPSELLSIIDEAIEDVAWINNYIKYNG